MRRILKKKKKKINAKGAGVEVSTLAPIFLTNYISMKGETV